MINYTYIIHFVLKGKYVIDYKHLKLYRLVLVVNRRKLISVIGGDKKRECFFLLRRSSIPNDYEDMDGLK